MPVTIKKQTIKYRNPDGTYTDFNAVAQESTADQIAGIQAAGAAEVQDIEAAGSAQVTAVNQAGATQIAAVEQAIEDKGEEVKASIPEEYSDLSADVVDLKSALNDIDDTLGEYIAQIEGKNKYNPATVTDGIMINNQTGAITESSTRETTDYIAVAQGQRVTVTENYKLNGVDVQNLVKPVYVPFYNANKEFITGGSFNTQNTEITAGCAYIRVSLSKLQEGRNYQIELTNNGTPTPYEPYQEGTTEVIADFVTEETEELLTDLSGIPNASGVAVGKALMVKTVADGKVTSWEFGSPAVIDDTLTQAGEAADAKATGDAIDKVKEEFAGNYVEYTSKESKDNQPVLIDKNNSTTGDLNTETGEIKTGNKLVSEFIDIRNTSRLYRSATTTTKLLSDSYCLYNDDKEFLAGFDGNTAYTFETIDGHANCVRYNLDVEGACYIRTLLSNNQTLSYYIVNTYSVYNAEIKEVVDARTDYNGTSRENLAGALENSYSEIKANFSATNAKIEALSAWESVGTADFVFPYRSAKKVKLTAESETTLGVHGITVADADHMGAVTYSNVEEVAYEGKGRKYRITALGSSGNSYRIGGNASGLTVGKTYRICLKVTDPQNDAAGGGHYAQVLCKTSVRSYGNTVSTEGVFTITFVATAITQAIYIYPFQTNGSGYTQAVGDEFVIEDWYINEINGDVDLYTHEAVMSESVTGTELQCNLNGAMFVATGTGATVSVIYVQSRLMSVNGIMPGYSGDLTVLSHIQSKKIVCFGDSITEKNLSSYQDYPYLSSLITGAETLNAGIGGSSMRYRENLDVWNLISFANIADMIVSGDFSDMVTAGNTSGFEKQGRCAELAITLAGVDWDSVDIITLAYGANDHATSALLSYLDDPANPKDKYKYIGAFRYAIEKLQTAYPRMRFLVLTPVFRWWTIDGNYTDSDTRQFPDITDQGYSYYYDWGDTLMGCAKNEYHIPCVDMYRELCANRVNHLWFSTDGVHPTEAGLKHMGERLGSALMSLL